MLANHAIAWMLTYLLHSTLLLGLAWLVSKPLSRWSVGAEETVWIEGTFRSTPARRAAALVSGFGAKK